MGNSNFTPGIGGLATNRYDFESHIEGTAFRHNATQVDLKPPVEINGIPYFNVEDVLNAVSSFVTQAQANGQGFVTIGDGYDCYAASDSTSPTPPNDSSPFDSTVPSLDAALNDLLNNTANPLHHRIRDGGIVVIKAGTYQIASTVNVPPGITIMGEGFGTKLCNTMTGGSPLFLIKADNVGTTYYGPRNSASSPDSGVNSSLFMFSRQTRFFNFTISDNFVEPKFLGDTSYKNTINSSQTAGLIMQEEGSNFSCDYMIFMGKSVGFGGANTSYAIGTNTSFGGGGVSSTTGTILSITNCFIDGFSIGGDFSTHGGVNDFLVFTNNRIRVFGNLESNATLASCNCVFSAAYCNVNYENNFIQPGNSRVKTNVYLYSIPQNFSTTIASLSDSTFLPQSTINVLSALAFPSSGTLNVVTTAGPQPITYTGTTSTSFTGCSGGVGEMQTGNVVNSTISTSVKVDIVGNNAAITSSFSPSPISVYTLNSGYDQSSILIKNSGNNFGADTIFYGGTNISSNPLPNLVINATDTYTNVRLDSGSYAFTTIASGSNGHNFTNPTIQVASTTGFPSSGWILVGNTGVPNPGIVAYTGTTPTSFTGCSGGGSGTINTGDSVVQPLVVSLPKASSVIPGRKFTFKDVTGVSGTSYIIINPSIGDTIEANDPTNKPYWVLDGAFESVTVVCDGVSNWSVYRSFGYDLTLDGALNMPNGSINIGFSDGSNIGSITLNGTLTVSNGEADFSTTASIVVAGSALFLPGSTLFVDGDGYVASTWKYITPITRTVVSSFGGTGYPVANNSELSGGIFATSTSLNLVGPIQNVSTDATSQIAGWNGSVGPILINGATLSSVSITYVVFGAHDLGPPGTLPSFALYRRSATNIGPGDSMNSITSFSNPGGTGSSWFNGGTLKTQNFTIDGFNVIDTSQYSYDYLLLDEFGSNAQNNNIFYTITWNFTNITSMPASG